MPRGKETGMMEIDRMYLTEKQVREITGIALSTLRNHRFLRRGIPYSRYGRKIIYAQEDVIAYLKNHQIKTESI